MELSLLRAHMDELRALGVREISIFGSVARGEAGPDSHVDVLVELGPGVGLFATSISATGCRRSSATASTWRRQTG